MRNSHRILICGALGLLALAPACGSEQAPDDQDTVSSQSAPLIGAQPDSTHPTVAKVQGASGFCTAIAIAPNLVLTALDCLSLFASNFNTLACVSGDPVGELGQIVSPAEVNFTFTNGQVVHGTSYITTGVVSLCKGDLAVVVVDSPIQNFTTVPQILWDSSPAVNDPLTGCSYGGLQSDTCAPQTGIECATAPVSLANGGLYGPSQQFIVPGEGVVGLQNCIDQGAPVYNAAGALAGLLTAQIQVDKTKVATPAKPCGFCDGTVSEFIILSQYQDLITRAYSSQGLSPWRAGHPKPADVGGTCVDSLDCNSQVCVGVGAEHYCSQYCDSAACPAGSVCTAAGDRSVCLPTVTPHPASCSVSAPGRSNDASSSGRGFWGTAMFVALSVIAAKRKRIWSMVRS